MDALLKLVHVCVGVFHLLVVPLLQVFCLGLEVVSFQLTQLVVPFGLDKLPDLRRTLMRKLSLERVEMLVFEKFEGT